MLNKRKYEKKCEIYKRYLHRQKNIMQEAKK